MNYEKCGNSIAVIKSNSIDKIIYNEYDDKDNIKTYFEELELNDKDEHFQLIPSKKRERDILYICGSSGSGKSYFTVQYVLEYHKIFPKNKIYVISSLKEDETLDKLKFIKRIKLDDKFLNVDLNIKDFKDTLVIADDIDVLKNKFIRSKVYNIIDEILEIGRHTKTSLIMTNHLVTNRGDTRRILNEAHSITYFPKTLGGRSLKYLLTDYLGLDKEQLVRLKTIKSRAITVIRSYPKIILSEKNLFIL